MKYFPLVWSGLWRKPTRTVLIFLSVTVAFLLFGLLRGMLSGLSGTVEGINANNLVVRSEGKEHPLPKYYSEQIKRVSDVRAVYSVTELDAHFQSENNRIRAWALGDMDFNSLTEYVVEKKYSDAFEVTRNGAIVGRRLANEQGWKVGDRVPLISERWVQRDRSRMWAFDIVGIYDRPAQPELAGDFWFHYEYLDQARVKENGTVDLFLVRTTSAKVNAQVSSEIDRLFTNSPLPTQTQTQRELLLSTVDQVLNVGLIVNAVVGASLFTLLVLTMASMMESAQQRVPEFAVMKTCGLRDATVFTLIISEGLILCVVAAIVGLVIAALLFPRLAAIGGLNGIGIPPQVVIEGLLMALTISLVSSAMPAWRAKRLTVVEALVRQH